MRLANVPMQAPYNVITYEIIGDGSGPTFFRLRTPSSGLIVITDTPLTRETALTYQVSKMAAVLQCMLGILLK